MAVRKCGWFLAVILTVGILLPTLAHSEFYMGPYLGPSFAGNLDPTWDFYKAKDPTAAEEPRDPGKFLWATRSAQGVRVNTSLLLGGKIGYWFTKKSVFGLQMPSWLKYFGFELDVGYQKLHWPDQAVTVSPTNFRQVLYANVTAVSVAFLFLARYGFYPDADVPLGRLQPYIGIGPVGFITNSYLNIGQKLSNAGGDFRCTSGDVGLAVETGLRYMIHPKVSLYAAFRYRYLPQHVSVDDSIFDLAPTTLSNIEMHSTYNMFDLIFGTAYHF
ncbi:MAG: outer membrane protein [Desulfobaccales bacterium]